jgi:tetratricopeptide (TPR) repeat protein
VALVAIGLLLSAPAASAQRAGRSAAQPPGEYSIDSDRVVEAVARGEGPQALAYFERVAAQAQQRGQRLPAARALQAAALAALDMALFPTALQAANRSLELFKAAPPGEISPTDLIRITQDYWHIGSAYRQTGDLGRARSALEEAVAFADGQLSGRRDTVIAGIVRNTLSTVTYAQHDYQTSLARATEAARIFEDVLAHPPPRTSETRTDQLRRLAALALAACARAELARGNRDAAEAAYDRALPYARQIPKRDVEVDILRSQGYLAVAHDDWPKALELFQKGLPLAAHLQRPTVVMWLHNDSARALGALGRFDEALAESREAVRRAEELRGELVDAEQRGAFLDDKQGIYRQAVRLALQDQRPDEAFALAERGRSRAFLDLLGSQTTLSKGRTRGLVNEEVRLRARLAEARALVRESADVEESERTGALVEAADRDYRAFLERVRSESREQASLMTVEPVTLPEIQGRLPEGTTLLEYLVDDEEVIVWVIERGRATVVRIPGDRQTLVTMVREFRSAIAKRSSLAAVRAGRGALRSAPGPSTRADRGRPAPDRAARRAPLSSVRCSPLAGQPMGRRGIRARDPTERERAPLRRGQGQRRCRPGARHRQSGSGRRSRAALGGARGSHGRPIRAGRDRAGAGRRHRGEGQRASRIGRTRPLRDPRRAEGIGSALVGAAPGTRRRRGRAARGP